MERKMKAKKKDGLISLVALALSVILVALSGLMVTAAATERSADEISRITRQISQEIYSPYCPGKTLAMCPSGNALDARMEIQTMAGQGMSVDEIKAEFIERYGEEFELVEPSTQDNLTLLGGIVAGLILAVAAVGILARRRLTGGEEVEVDEHSGDDDKRGMDGAVDDSYLDELRAQYRD